MIVGFDLDVLEFHGTYQIYSPHLPEIISRIKSILEENDIVFDISEISKIEKTVNQNKTYGLKLGENNLDAIFITPIDEDELKVRIKNIIRGNLNLAENTVLEMRAEELT